MEGCTAIVLSLVIKIMPGRMNDCDLIGRLVFTEVQSELICDSAYEQPLQTRLAFMIGRLDWGHDMGAWPQSSQAW